MSHYFVLVRECKQTVFHTKLACSVPPVCLCAAAASWCPRGCWWRSRCGHWALPSAWRTSSTSRGRSSCPAGRQTVGSNPCSAAPASHSCTVQWTQRYLELEWRCSDWGYPDRSKCPDAGIVLNYTISWQNNLQIVGSTLTLLWKQRTNKQLFHNFLQTLKIMWSPFWQQDTTLSSWHATDLITWLNGTERVAMETSWNRTVHIMTPSGCT